MARVQVTSYFKIVWTKKVVTHFLILIDRGMQEEDVCVFNEPQEMKMISPPPLLIDSRLQTTKDFQLCPLFLIRSVGIPGSVCCPVTSLRALCLISWPGRNLIFIWDTNYLWTKYLYLVMQWQTIQWPVKMIEIYKLCHNWIVCQPEQPRSVNIPGPRWQNDNGTGGGGGQAEESGKTISQKWRSF